MGDDDVLVAFVVTEEGEPYWRALGGYWARANTEWEEDIDAFPLWQFLFTQVRDHCQVGRTVFCGPDADPDVTVVFRAPGEFGWDNPVYRRGPGIWSAGSGWEPQRHFPLPAVVASAPTRTSAVDAEVLLTSDGLSMNADGLSSSETWEKIGAYVDNVARSLGKGQRPTQSVDSVGELVTVELVAELGREAIAILEPLLGLAERVLGDDSLDSATGRMLERDSRYLRDELYENPDHLDAPIVVAASHRMLRILRSALAGDAPTVLDELLAAAPDPLAPQGAIAAADVLADHVDHESPYEWVASKLGWYSYVLKDMAQSAKDGAVDFAGFSGGAVSMLAALGVDGVVAILVSVYIGLLATAWRSRAKQ